jgi:hypothetical protein
LDAYFIQTDTIDLISYPNWEPIGDADERFRGHYDGAGLPIYNLTINRADEDYVGLFGHFGATDGTFENSVSIKNVVLNTVDVTGKVWVGSLVGKVTGGPNTVIENSYVINGTVKGNGSTGGLVGANNTGSSQTITTLRPIILTSFSNVNVEYVDISGGENNRIGGLVGCNTSGLIINSYSASIVIVTGTTSVQAVGGLVGCMTNSGRIENSYASGQMNISGSVTSVGGLIGNREGINATVVNSYWDVETTGQSSSAGGSGKTTAQMQKESTFNNWLFDDVWDILEDQSYPFLLGTDQLSGFEVTGPITIEAGENFNLDITNASDVNGVILNGYFQVTINTNISGEANGGTVFNNVVQFISGGTDISNLTLTVADDHELSISIQSIANAEIFPITVTPAAAVGLFISQQPAAVISGSNDDQPANLGNIEVISIDQFGNPSAIGLDAVQNVTVDIENDGSPGNDAILGDETVNIQTGSASFNNLTLDKQGTGYTLKFTSNSPELLGDVITTPFDVVDINDLSVFTVSADSPQYSGIEFDVTLTGAADNDGSLLSGPVNVSIVSDINGETFSFNGVVSFLDGHAVIPVTLNVSETAGLVHTLTVSVTGIAEEKTLAITVFPDQSGFTIVDPGQQYQGFAFDLELTGATWVDGSVVTGDVAVTITSDLDGELYNGPLTFSTGETATPITLTTLGDHTITVSVDGITSDENIVVNVAANVSGFDVAEITNSQTAGVEFNLNITNAINTGGSLNGSFAVTVTSNISGEPNEGVVFDGPVTFASGAATFGITLTKAANPNQITIAIETILPTETLDIEVIAADAEKLAITQQPVTVIEGNNDNSPAPLGTIILEARDAFDNLAFGNLTSQQVTVTLQTDGSGDGAALGGTLSVDIINGIATFSNLTLDKEGIGYVLRFTSSSSVDLGSVDTDPFDVTGINDLSGFDIVDPGPQVSGVIFNLNIINARESSGDLINTTERVAIGRALPSPPFYFPLFDGNVDFVEGSGQQSISINVTGNILTYVTIYNNDEPFEDITILVVDTDASNLSLELIPSEDPTAGEVFNVAITGQDKAGNLLVGEHFITLSTDNIEEGTGGILFEGDVTFVDGDYTLNAVTLFKAGVQNLSVETPWVSNPGTLEVTVLPNVVDTLVITQQPTGGSGTGNDTPAPISSADVILQFQDAWGNASADGLDINAQLIVSIENDGSLGKGASLNGTDTLDILADQSDYIFSDLNLDKDGIGYTLKFVYGDPEVFSAISDPFNMTNINTYGITVNADDPLVFDDVQVGYLPVAAQEVTISRIGEGDIVELTVSLDEGINSNFEITQPVPDELINANNLTTFTVRPLDGLLAGLYVDTVTVTANPGLDSEQVIRFGVRFRVLEAFAIEVDADDPLVFPTVSQTYNNNELEQTVTITNIGFGAITGLTATLGGVNSTDFIITQPVPTSIATDNTSTFTIKPDEELEVGTYTATVTVDNEQDAEVSFNIVFTVVKEFIWVGSVSDKWHTYQNWDEGAVPGEDDFIRIPSVRAQDPYIWDLNVTVSNLIIESDVELKVRSNRSLTIKEGGRVTVNPGGKLTLNEGTGVLTNNAGVDGLILESDANNTASLILFNGGVEATVERYLYGTHANFQHITSTSVAGQSFESFFADNHGILGYFEPIYAMREYDEGSGWTPYFNENKEGELQVGTAYIIGPSQPGKLTFKGEIRHNNLTKGLTHTTFGWNGIGNPFTAPIDIGSFFDINADGFFEGFEALYIYDPASAPGYQTLNNTTKEIGGLSEIAIGQGFIVKADEGGANFSFTTGMRKHAETQFFKDQDNRSNWYSLKLKVSNSIRNMTTLVAFNENMNMGLDATYDAGQFQASSAFNLFTRTPEELSELNLSIQALPDFGLEDVYIPVGFKYPQGGEVIFSAESMNLPEHFEARFYDSQEDIYINLSEEDYTVVLAVSSEPVGRFFLLMKSQIMHMVNYDALNEGGDITASVNGETIDTGSMVSDGSSVSFFAIAHNGYEIEHWLIDGVILDDVTVSEIIIEELLGDLHVQVSFKETSTQIDETFADDDLIIYIFENQLIIRGEMGENARAILYDMLGRQMRVESLQPGEFNSFSVEGLKPGAYVILIQENNRQSTRKLLLD